MFVCSSVLLGQKAERGSLYISPLGSKPLQPEMEGLLKSSAIQSGEMYVGAYSSLVLHHIQPMTSLGCTTVAFYYQFQCLISSVDCLVMYQETRVSLHSFYQLGILRCPYQLYRPYMCMACCKCVRGCSIELASNHNLVCKCVSCM